MDNREENNMTVEQEKTENMTEKTASTTVGTEASETKKEQKKSKNWYRREQQCSRFVDQTDKCKVNRI